MRGTHAAIMSSSIVALKGQYRLCADGELLLHSGQAGGDRKPAVMASRSNVG